MSIVPKTGTSKEERDLGHEYTLREDAYERDGDPIGALLIFVVCLSLIIAAWAFLL